MKSEWIENTITGRVVHRRIMRVGRAFINASVWQVHPSLMWEWMAVSDTTVLTGRSKSLAGAKRNASRAMHNLRREIEGGR